MVAVGLMEGRSAIDVELNGVFTDRAGTAYKGGNYQLTSEVTLTPSDAASCSFALEDVTIGIGFHWERKERQVFRGALRIIKRDAGLTVVNDVPLEEYVKSVISSEMSASCPIELLKAHAVISRSWLLAFPSSQRRVGENASADLSLRLRPTGLALRATPSAPSLRSAQPPLLCEEGNVQFSRNLRATSRSHFSLECGMFGLYSHCPDHSTG